MLGSLLPACVTSKEIRGDPPKPQLFPEEERVVMSSVAERRAEFATARGCARSAMAELGLQPIPIPKGLKGEPQWPDGIVGSITHCHGYRAAAVGRRNEIAGIGIDAEPHLSLPAGVVYDIALPEERSAMSELARFRSDVHWDRIYFSAKEAVYKTWFPLARTGLDFQQCRLCFDPWGDTFKVEIRTFGPPTKPTLSASIGRWTVADGLIVTALTVRGED